MTNCEACDIEIDESSECEICGMAGLCEDCAAVCCADDEYYFQEFDEFSDAEPGL